MERSPRELPEKPQGVSPSRLRESPRGARQASDDIAAGMLFPVVALLFQVLQTHVLERLVRAPTTGKGPRLLIAFDADLDPGEVIWISNHIDGC